MLKKFSIKLLFLALCLFIQIESQASHPQNQTVPIPLINKTLTNFSLIAKNYQKLRILYNKNIGNDESQIPYLTLGEFNRSDIQNYRQTNSILKSTQKQIKAMSSQLGCVLIYYPQQNILQSIKFSQNSSQSQIIGIKNEQLLTVCKLNLFEFNISNGCSMIKFKSFIYYFNPLTKVYQRINNSFSDSQNPVFSDKMGYVVADNSIYRFNKTNKKYKLFQEVKFLKNKKVWIHKQKMIVLSWQQEKQLFSNRYQINIFKWSKQTQQNLLQTYSGLFYSQQINQNPQVFLSPNLQTILIETNSTQKNHLKLAIRIDFQNNKTDQFQINEKFKLSKNKIDFQNNFMFVTSQKKDQQKINIYKINERQIVFLNTLPVNQEKKPIFRTFDYSQEMELLNITNIYYHQNLIRFENKIISFKQYNIQEQSSWANIIWQIIIYSLLIFLVICCLFLYLIYQCRQLFQKIFQDLILRPIKNQIKQIDEFMEQIYAEKVKNELKVHLQNLNIPKQIAEDIKLLDIQKLKSSFTKLIRQLSVSKQINLTIKQKRIKTNRAYQYLCQKIHQVNLSYHEQVLMDYVINENLASLQRILERNPSFVNHRFKGSNYPLIYFAVRSGCYDIVELILKKGCRLDFKNDKSTPMHCAAYYGHHKIICLLLEHGIPVNIKNSFSKLPIQQACSEEIKSLLEDADQDNIYKLIQELCDEKLCLSTFNLKKDNKIIARKVILHNSQKNFDGYQDAFYGTSFKNLKSIAKHSLKKIGDVVDDIQIKLVKGHSQNEKWAKAVFVSPSLLYAGCSVYGKQTINTTNKLTEIWLPIVQVKVKRQSYTKCKSTVPNYVYKDGEPQEVEFRIEMNTDACKQKLSVVAILLIQKEYLDSIKNYSEVVQMFLTKKN